MASSLKWRDDWEEEEAEVAALQRLADEKSEEEEDDEDENDSDEEDDEEVEDVKSEVGGEGTEIQFSTAEDPEEIITSDMPMAESPPIVIATGNENSIGLACVSASEFKDTSFDNEEGEVQQFSVVVENPVASSPLEITAENVDENQVINIES